MIDCAQMYIAKLEAENLKYTTRDLPDGGIIVSVMFNMVFTHAIFQSSDNGKHVAFRTQLEAVPAEKVNDLLVVCNSLNTQLTFFPIPSLRKRQRAAVEPRASPSAWVCPATTTREAVSSSAFRALILSSARTNMDGNNLRWQIYKRLLLLRNHFFNFVGSLENYKTLE